MDTSKYDFFAEEVDMVKLAREIAMDIRPLADILKHYSVDDYAWVRLQRNPRFQQLVTMEIEDWQTALNTTGRVRVKSAAMLEEWLPELYLRLHDRSQATPALVEAGKMLARFAGITERVIDAGNASERFTITINMGPEVKNKVAFTKDVTPQLIDAEPEQAPPPEDVWGSVK